VFTVKIIRKTQIYSVGKCTVFECQKWLYKPVVSSSRGWTQNHCAARRVT